LILLDQDTFSGVEHLESMIERAGLREEKKYGAGQAGCGAGNRFSLSLPKDWFSTVATHPTGRVQEIPNPDFRGKEDFPPRGILANNLKNFTEG
jgi:hypothetical protein